MKLHLKAARLSAALLALSVPSLIWLPQATLAQEEPAGAGAAVSKAQALLNDAGNLAGLSEDDIKSRIRSARKLAKSRELPEDLRGALDGFISAARQELITRQSQAEQPVQQQPEQPVQEQAPAEQAQQPEQQQQPAQAVEPAQEKPAADAAAIASAQKILARAGSLGTLAEEDIKADVKTARRLVKTGGLPDDIRGALENYIGTARQELVTRQAQQQEQPAAPDSQQSEAPAEQPADQAGKQPSGQVDDAAQAEAQAILDGGSSLASMSENDIKSRIKTARKLSKSDGVADDTRTALQEFIDVARRELVSREAKSQGQQTGEQPAPKPDTTEQPVQEQAPAEQAQQPEQEQQPAQALEPAQEKPAIDAAAVALAQEILARAGNLGALAEEDIKADVKTARRLVKTGGLPDDIRGALENYIGTARQELVTRQARQQEQPAAPDSQQSEAPTEQPADQAGKQPSGQVDDAAQAEAQAILDGGSSLASMSENDIKSRIKTARKLSKSDGVADDTRTALQEFIDVARRELVSREAKSQGQQTGEQPAPKPDTTEQQPQRTVEEAPPAPTPPPSEAENRAVEKPDVSQEAEAKAAGFLADQTNVAKMDDDALKGRLESYRELLDDGQLSRETERSLRNKLKAEREILRARVAARKLAEQQAAAADQAGAGSAETASGTTSSKGSKGAGKSEPEINFNGPVSIVYLDQRATREEMNFVVNDRRPLNDLSGVELNRRIFIYRDLARDDRYDERQLASLRDGLGESRRELHRRYGRDKVTRGRELERRRKRNELDIDINIDLGVGASAPPPVIWAAEEDDWDIEQQLIARPRKRIERTYPREVLFDEPEVVLTRPEVRDSLPSVELDTITFGFNEAFVREEEVSDLDRVGSIMERIVTAHPDEVFVIEGHTDAVGSDAYNLKLSKSRAVAIKDVLLEFYNIDEGNITTVGLGERYLKIPTPDPEQENRRGTIRRVTPLVAGYDLEE